MDYTVRLECMLSLWPGDQLPIDVSMSIVQILYGPRYKQC